MSESNNRVRIHTSSSPVSMSVSSARINDSLEIMNNKSKYYAELALKYKNESKDILDRVIYHAENNSNITKEDVNRIKFQLEAQIAEKQNIGDYVLNSDLATVATSGDYDDLSNKPIIPSVDQTYDGTSANAQSGAAIAGAGFLTNINSTDVTNALTYTPASTDLSNLSAGLSNTICTVVPTTTSTASSTTPAVVVENYVNGASWYRVYSDKWCEQGGIKTQSSTSIVIDLLKPYKDTNYFVVAIPNGNSNDTGGFTSFSAPSGASPYDYGRATDKFRLTTYNSSGMIQSWFACGYIN